MVAQTNYLGPQRLIAIGKMLLKVLIFAFCFKAHLAFDLLDNIDN